MIPAEEAVAFIWSGQTGLGELAVEFSRRCHFHPHEALHHLNDYRYFAPILRSRPASTKDAVAAEADILWADIDSRDAISRIDERLRRRLGIEPSLIIDSGNKGYWAYLKLDCPIPTAEVELLNQRLGLLLEADHAWNCDRLARIPGSIHPESGRQVEIVDLAATVHDPAFLVEALPELPAQDLPSLEYISEEGEEMAGLPEWPLLTDELWVYIKRHPEKGEGYDRSEVEQKIFTILIHRGWTDQQIIEFADQVALPKHVEERMRRKSYGWTIHSIKNAREYVLRSGKADQSENSSSSTYIHASMCTRSCRYQHLDRLSLLKHLPGLAIGEAIEKALTVFDVSERTIFYALRQLEDAGYIRRQPEGRRRLIVLTQKGENAISRRFRSPIVVHGVRGPAGPERMVSR